MRIRIIYMDEETSVFNLPKSTDKAKAEVEAQIKQPGLWNRFKTGAKEVYKKCTFRN